MATWPGVKSAPPQAEKKATPPEDSADVHGSCHPINAKNLYDIYTMSDQRRRRWPTLYKCYTNGLCLLGMHITITTDHDQDRAKSQSDLHVIFCGPPCEKVHPVVQDLGGGPRVVVSTAAFHARVRGSVPGLGGLKERKLFLPHPRVKVSIVGSLRDREVACSASDRQGSNFESCVWRTVSSQSSHHPQEVLLAQFSLYVHKGGLKPDSFHLVQDLLQLFMPSFKF